ncbi:MAG TPA: hypothetical protein VEC12_00265, partial [Bacteroidia bacterium]|nr:hypothetical protein [Bacteroidia bacterium]
EFTWFFKPPGNPLMKHGITARFMYSVNKYSRQYKGPYIYSSVSEIHQEMTFYSSTRNYFVSIGYRLQHAILKRLNFITGAEGILCLP